MIVEWIKAVLMMQLQTYSSVFSRVSGHVHGHREDAGKGIPSIPHHPPAEGNPDTTDAA